MRKDEIEIREGVRKAYSAAAEKPRGKHPFPVGRGFARSLGYDWKLLASLPSISVKAFAGVSNVSMFATIKPGAVVLDLGCGAGLDTLIAARKTGPSGRVIGVDFSQTMLARARKAVEEESASQVVLIQSEAENLPLADRSVDLVLANGIFNLNPNWEAIFSELARVVRPGGEVFTAELVLKEPVLNDIQSSEDDWFA